MDDLIQLKITLQGTKPPIWRQIIVDRKTTFFALHHIIQITMGWDNSHLYEFNVNNNRIGELNDDYDDFFAGDNFFDASIATLESFITATKQKFQYEYDFGDGWTHKILVEKFLPRDPKAKYPSCIAGKLNCPPEDCGGVVGFYDLLDIIKDKKHPEQKEMLEWLGGDYDPNYFDAGKINKDLRNLDRFLKRQIDEK